MLRTSPTSRAGVEHIPGGLERVIVFTAVILYIPREETLSSVW